MKISNAHNLHRPPSATSTGTFGIQVSIPATDPFARLLDEGWTKQHWFDTRADRDAAIRDMQRIHEYSRPNDAPTPVYKPIERDGVN